MSTWRMSCCEHASVRSVICEYFFWDTPFGSLKLLCDFLTRKECHSSFLLSHAKDTYNLSHSQGICTAQHRLEPGCQHSTHVAAQHKFGSAEVVVHQLLHVQWPPEQECYQEKQKLSSMHAVRSPLPAVPCNGMDVGSLYCYKSSISERGVSLKIRSKWSKSHRVPSLTSVYLSQILIAHFAGKHKRLSFN